jgi:N-acetylglutamate synthase-like GNAT family acetyltransferase
MTKLKFQPLLPIRFPLIVRFYKSHYSTSKPKKHDCIWVAENTQGIQGVVRFQQNDDNQFLTGMAIASEYRRQGIGNQLLNAVKSQCEERTCYCFAYANLTSFYQNHGFNLCDENDLPDSLKIKWQQIQKGKKNVVAMYYSSDKTKKG